MPGTRALDHIHTHSNKAVWSVPDDGISLLLLLLLLAI